MNENGIDMNTLNETIIDVPEDKITEINKQEKSLVERREDGYYYTMVPVYLPLPNEEEFHASLVLPLLLNCAGVPLNLEIDGKSTTVGTITSNIGIDQSEGVFALEVRLEGEPVPDIINQSYLISVEAGLPDDVMDKNNNYSHKDLVEMVNVTQVVLEPPIEEETILN